MKYFSYYAERTKFTLSSKLIISAFLSAVMFVFILMTGDTLQLYGSDLAECAAYFTLFYFAGMVIFFYGKKIEKTESILFFGAAFAAAVYIRCALMYYVSNDYNVFLKPWIDQLSSYKGLSGLTADVGDYTMPYRYFLMLLAKIGGNHVIHIKMFSLVFDLVGAYFAMKIVELKSSSVVVRGFAFLLPLIAPTVFFNSAMWGQCDMMFTAFCLGGLYFALRDNGRGAVIMLSVAFCFKMQTVFFAPVFIVLFLIGKIKWRHLLWFPAILLISVLPAAFAGRSVISSLSVYILQTREYPYLYLNIPNLWCLTGEYDALPYGNFKMIAIMLAAVAVCALIYVSYKYRHMLDSRRIINLAFIGALIIPFLLPSMHERYFFAADVMSIIYFFYNKKRWYVPMGVIFASFVCCSYYLYGTIACKYSYLSLILAVILAQALYDYVTELMSGRRPENPLCIADGQTDFPCENTQDVRIANDGTADIIESDDKDIMPDQSDALSDANTD